MRPILVGRIVGVFGLRGEVKLAAADRDVFRGGLELLLKLPSGGQRSVNVDNFRLHGNAVILQLRGIDDPQAAAALRDAYAFAARRDLPKLPPNAYRTVDLIGMRVIDKTLGALGEVREIRRYPSCDMLVVGARQLLVPALRVYCFEVDGTSGEIRVQLPAGFDELIG